MAGDALSVFYRAVQADPANVTQALAKAARQRGVRIFENTRVTGIRQADGRVTGVDTAEGAISAEYVVNCAGLWAREVGRWAGVNVPLLAAEHFYVVTDASPDIPRNLPVLRVPDESAYIKEEAGKLLIGFFEPNGKALPAWPRYTTANGETMVLDDVSVARNDPDREARKALPSL